MRITPKDAFLHPYFDKIKEKNWNQTIKNNININI